MIDEGRQPETVTVTVGDQVISAYVYSAAHSTEERVFQLIDELFRKARETPITITRSELVEAVGVCERSISEALSRLRSASRLVSTRHGHKIYYQTITQPHQPELVSVAAISSRPPTAQPPRTRRGDAAQPPSTHREDAAQPPRTRREDAAQPPRTHREDAAQPPRTHREDAAQPPRTHREDAAQPPRTHREDAAQSPRTHREGDAQAARNREEGGAQAAGSREEGGAQIPLVSCPRCGPGSMVPTKSRALQNASLPGTTYYCAGSNRSCSLLWHSTAGVIYEGGQRQLTRDEATILVQRRLGKPEPALPTDGTKQQRGGYLDSYRRRFGQLPWETAEGQRLIDGVVQINADGDDPEPHARAPAPAPAGRPARLNINQDKPELLTGPAGAHTRENRPDGTDRIAERPP